MVFMLTHKIHSIAKVVWPVDKLYDYVLCVYSKRKQGNFHWAKLSRYPQYMDFHGNTFAVQGQGPIYVYT